MCGRYYLENSIMLERLMAEVTFKVGEIFPGDSVPILISKTKVAIRQFGKPVNKGMLLNARSETLLLKPTFAHLQHGLVLASSYFEWDSNKTKYQFFFQKNQYMCCVYDSNYFYILTTASSHTIHNRQPLFVSGKDAMNWLNNQNTSEILALSPISLTIKEAN